MCNLGCEMVVFVGLWMPVAFSCWLRASKQVATCWSLFTVTESLHIACVLCWKSPLIFVVGVQLNGFFNFTMHFGNSFSWGKGLVYALLIDIKDSSWQYTFLLVRRWMQTWIAMCLFLFAKGLGDRSSPNLIGLRICRVCRSLVFVGFLFIHQYYILCLFWWKTKRKIRYLFFNHIL